eukprot:jgi/Mesvir1/244/Mv13586-RA.2
MSWIKKRFSSRGTSSPTEPSRGQGPSSPDDVRARWQHYVCQTLVLIKIEKENARREREERAAKRRQLASIGGSKTPLARSVSTASTNGSDDGLLGDDPFEDGMLSSLRIRTDALSGSHGRQRKLVLAAPQAPGQWPGKLVAAEDRGLSRRSSNLSDGGAPSGDLTGDMGFLPSLPDGPDAIIPDSPLLMKGTPRALSVQLLEAKATEAAALDNWAFDAAACHMDGELDNLVLMTAARLDASVGATLASTGGDGAHPLDWTADLGVPSIASGIPRDPGAAMSPREGLREMRASTTDGKRSSFSASEPAGSSPERDVGSIRDSSNSAPGNLGKGVGGESPALAPEPSLSTPDPKHHVPKRLKKLLSGIVVDVLDKMQAHVSEGRVPEEIRQALWQELARQYEGKVSIEASAEPLLDYSTLVAAPETDTHKEIERDVHRTFPDHPLFIQQWGPGQTAMFRVLKAYAQLDPEVGYCQGMAFVAATLLLVVGTGEEELAFCLLVYLMYNAGLRNTFLPNMEQLQLRLHQVVMLQKDRLPELHNHLEDLMVSSVMYAAPWFLTLFASALPLAIVYRIFDTVFVERNAVIIFKVGIALLADCEDELLECEATEDVMDFFRSALPAKMQAASVSELDDIFDKALATEVKFEALMKLEAEYEIIMEEAAVAVAEASAAAAAGHLARQAWDEQRSELERRLAEAMQRQAEAEAAVARASSKNNNGAGADTSGILEPSGWAVPCGCVLCDRHAAALQLRYLGGDGQGLGFAGEGGAEEGISRNPSEGEVAAEGGVSGRFKGVISGVLGRASSDREFWHRLSVGMSPMGEYHVGGARPSPLVNRSASFAAPASKHMGVMISRSLYPQQVFRAAAKWRINTNLRRSITHIVSGSPLGSDPQPVSPSHAPPPSVLSAIQSSPAGGSAAGGESAVPGKGPAGSSTRSGEDAAISLALSLLRLRGEQGNAAAAAAASTSSTAGSVSNATALASAKDVRGSAEGVFGDIGGAGLSREDKGGGGGDVAPENAPLPAGQEEAILRTASTVAPAVLRWLGHPEFSRSSTMDSSRPLFGGDEDGVGGPGGLHDHDDVLLGEDDSGEGASLGWGPLDTRGAEGAGDRVTSSAAGNATPGMPPRGPVGSSVDARRGYRQEGGSEGSPQMKPVPGRQDSGALIDLAELPAASKNSVIGRDNVGPGPRPPSLRSSVTLSTPAGSPQVDLLSAAAPPLSPGVFTLESFLQGPSLEAGRSSARSSEDLASRTIRGGVIQGVGQLGGHAGGVLVRDGSGVDNGTSSSVPASASIGHASESHRLADVVAAAANAALASLGGDAFPGTQEEEEDIAELAGRAGNVTQGAGSSVRRQTNAAWGLAGPGRGGVDVASQSCRNIPTNSIPGGASRWSVGSESGGSDDGSGGGLGLSDRTASGTFMKIKRWTTTPEGAVSFASVGAEPSGNSIFVSHPPVHPRHGPKGPGDSSAGLTSVPETGVLAAVTAENAALHEKVAQLTAEQAKMKALLAATQAQLASVLMGAPSAS